MVYIPVKGDFVVLMRVNFACLIITSNVRTYFMQCWLLIG